MRLTCQVSFEVSLLGYFVRLVCQVTVASGRLGKAGVYMQLSTPCLVDPV